MSVRKAPSAKYSALSSACASCFSQLVMVPCETIKIQLQLFQKTAVKGESVLLRSIRVIYKSEGLRGFWRGYFVSLSCSVPSCAIYYATFETLRRQAYEYCETHPKWAPFVPAATSSCAQIVTCLCTSPIDRIRTQYWANRSQSIRNLLHDTMEEARSRGVSSLYHGLRPLLLRDICFSSVYWTVYEQLHSVTASLGVPIIFQNLIAASVGGMLTSATVTPFDLVKTRQQVLRTTEPIFTTMKMIYKEEGVHGLFRGLTPRIAQTIPSIL
ncbi:hypothetical protein WA588_006339 [Blastocystis sp. NMH]